MTKDNALTLALEALERISDRFDLESVAQDATKAITAIKEALAQPEQEPLDFAYVMEAGDDRWKKLPIQERNFCPRCGKRTADLSTIHTCTPPQRPWVGLTVDELIDLERKHLSHENLTRAIEDRLREKNT